METPTDGNATTWENKGYSKTEATDTETTKTELSKINTLVSDDDDKITTASSSQIEMAKKMLLLDMDLETIMKITELNKEAIENLCK